MNGTDRSIHCILIRHGATKGNAEKRYIGCRTDEPLSVIGAAAISKDIAAGRDDLVFTSPMKRAVETAELMFPGLTGIVIEELTETDFGLFEGKNYLELNGNAEYQSWIDSGGTAPFPGGESPDEFRARSVRGFEKALRSSLEAGCDRIWIVAHGGTLMSVMSHLTGKDYFDFQVSCGHGFEICCTVNAGPDGELRYECTHWQPWRSDVGREKL